MVLVSFDVTEGDWIRVAQLQNPIIVAIIFKILESGDVQPETKYCFELYDLKSGVVFRRTEHSNKWLVSRAARFNVVKMYRHDQGHF